MVARFENQLLDQTMCSYLLWYYSVKHGTDAQGVIRSFAVDAVLVKKAWLLYRLLTTLPLERVTDKQTPISWHKGTSQFCQNIQG